MDKILALRTLNYNGSPHKVSTGMGGCASAGLAGPAVLPFAAGGPRVEEGSFDPLYFPLPLPFPFFSSGARSLGDLGGAVVSGARGLGDDLGGVCPLGVGGEESPWEPVSTARTQLVSNVVRQHRDGC